MSLPALPEEANDGAVLDALVLRARDDDDLAFAELVASTHQQVLRCVLPYCDSLDEAEDIVQDTFIAAKRHLGSYRGPARFVAWIRQIARRTASRSRRGRHRRALLQTAARGWLDRTAYITDPGARVDQNMMAERIRNLWSELPKQQRVVFDLVDLQNVPPADAAEQLNMKAVTLRAHLFKARRQLRSRLLAMQDNPGASPP